MNKESVAVGLDSNVNIKILDRSGHIIREVNQHNKATSQLVEGIVKFLKGEFSSPITNQSGGQLSPDETLPYVPVSAVFGYVGVHTQTVDGQRYFDHFAPDEVTLPAFSTRFLQEPCKRNGNLVRYNFSKIRTTSFSDDNNSLGLEFSLYITPSAGGLVGYIDSSTFKPNDWTYYNPDPEVKSYQAMLSEVGLFSGTSDIPLARVVFKNGVATVGTGSSAYPSSSDLNKEGAPIVQSQSTSIVLTWTINITSIGDNDTFVTNSSLPTTTSESLSQALYNSLKSSTLTEAAIKTALDSQISGSSLTVTKS